MREYIEPDRTLWRSIVTRPSSEDPEVETRVNEILRQVRESGDDAVASITYNIEGLALPGMEISREEIAAAAGMIAPGLKDAIALARSNIMKFHEAQADRTVEVETMPGVKCFRRAMPIRRVGIYIPGGTAPLFSTVLMLAVPAKLAGCREVVMCTPRGRDGKVAPAVLYAADLCGVDRIFGIGGAQAVAAMAYGTGTVPKVDKIFGPGNRYVSMAKRLVNGQGVAVDMFAGPSEVLVMADGSCDPRFVAADLLSQAEHGRDSQVCLLTDNEELSIRILKELSCRLDRLPRRETAGAALEGSLSVVLRSREDMVDFADAYAPEHLIISMSDPWEIAGKVNAAGSVFIGNFSPESAGDYASGTNHTLPTSGTATACSGVGVDSFMHYVTYQEITRKGLENLSGAIVQMAEAEGLDAHAEAVRVRM